MKEVEKDEWGGVISAISASGAEIIATQLSPIYFAFVRLFYTTHIAIMAERPQIISTSRSSLVLMRPKRDQN